MNLIVGAPWWLVAVLILALAAAAVEDAVRLRISNLACAAVLVAGLVAVAIHGLSPALWQNAVVCMAVLVLGTAVFAAGWLGGGDIKLLAAIGFWLDLRAAAGLIAAVFAAGGVVALIYLLARRIADNDRGSRHTAVPYGLAIVLGAAFIFATQLRHASSDPFLARFPALQATQR